MSAPETKPETQDVLEIDQPEQLKALGHPLRLKVLQVLGESEEPLTNRELAARLSVDPGHLHFHVRMLHRAGLIELRRDRRDARSRTARSRSTSRSVQRFAPRAWQVSCRRHSSASFSAASSCTRRTASFAARRCTRRSRSRRCAPCSTSCSRASTISRTTRTRCRRSRSRSTLPSSRARRTRAAPASRAAGRRARAEPRAAAGRAPCLRRGCPRGTPRVSRTTRRPNRRPRYSPRRRRQR